MFARSLLMTGALALVASACLDSSGGPLSPEDATFASSLGIELSAMTRHSTGVYYQDLEMGTGVTAEPGDEITVHYTGWTRDGASFDTSVGGSPVAFPLTAPPLIPGWVIGLDGMMEGGVRKLVIPSELAYGSGSREGIPANSILIFEVELIAVADTDPS